MIHKEFLDFLNLNPDVAENFDTMDFWVCDFRYDDYGNKPIRHVEPTLVRASTNENLPKNKKVYYSDHHFRPVGKNGLPTAKIIAPYDNTGFRSYTGKSLNIFLTEKECRAHYVALCVTAIEGLTDYKNSLTENIDKTIAVIAERIKL